MTRQSFCTHNDSPQRAEILLLLNHSWSPAQENTSSTPAPREHPLCQNEMQQSDSTILTTAAMIDLNTFIFTATAIA